MRNRIDLPSGDQSKGQPDPRLGAINSEVPLPSDARLHKPVSSPRNDMKAIKRSSADQIGCMSSYSSRVRRVLISRSTSWIQMSASPPSSEDTATCRPS